MGLVQTQPNKFEIGRDKLGKPKYETRLADYTDPQAAIRGHKLYWHKGEVTLGDIESQGKAKDAVLTRIRPLRAGVEFRFRIRFDNLSDVELGALLWTLQIAADDRYRLKLGMGKPLGLGANKSYGFIKPYGGGPDVFVRLDALPPGQTTLVQGRRVRYVLHEDGEETTRPKAKSVLPDR